MEESSIVQTVQSLAKVIIETYPNFKQLALSKDGLPTSYTSSMCHTMTRPSPRLLILRTHGHNKPRYL